MQVHITPSTFGDTADATLTIDSSSGTFTVTTQAADAAPKGFSFDAIPNAEPNFTVISNEITASEINT